MFSDRVTDFFLPRLEAAVTIPCTLTRVLDIPLGLVSSALDLITLGSVRPIYRFNDKQRRATSSILSQIFMNTLNVVNPAASLEEHWQIADVDRLDSGIVSESTINFFDKTVASLESKPAKFHILGRCLYLIAIPTITVLKIVDLAIGLLAGVASFLTLGMLPKVNATAAVGLKVISLISDIPILATKALNPYAYIHF